MNRIVRYLVMLRRTSWPMTLIVALLAVIGVFFIYSACYVSDELPVRALYSRQIVWALVGFCSYLFFAGHDYRRLRRWADWLYATAIVLLVAVLLIGTSRHGGRRWLMFFNVGVQPSELAKIATMIMLARIMGRPDVDAGSGATIVKLLAIVAIPVLLIVKEPDLGTAMVFLPMSAVMMFVGGVPWRTLLGLALAGALLVGVLLAAVLLPERLDLSEEATERIPRLTGLSDYQRTRILVFFDSDRDPLGAGWNRRQSEIAVGSGGVWGKGFRRGTQNILGFLPRSVAPTDFVYSVIAEEKGFMGSLVVLVLFGSLINSGMRTGLRTRDKFGRLLCAGAVSMLFFHVFINIAMTVGLMPITGLPLPFLSYGGSFMMVTMSALGIVQSIRVRSRPREHSIFARRLGDGTGVLS